MVMTVRTRRIWCVALLTAATIAAACYGWYYFSIQQQARQLRLKRQAHWDRLTLQVRQEVSKFGGSVGLIIKDLHGGREIKIADQQRFAAASLVKIPIMTAAFIAAANKHLDLDGRITIKEGQKTGGSGQLKAIPGELTLSVRELISYMITRSDNTAANALIDVLGMEQLNHSCAAQGLKNTTLSRKMMDFRYRRNGHENYTTAADMAQVLERIYRSQIVSRPVSAACLRLLAQQRINDRIPARLPQSVPVAHKTGLERYVCHDAGIVFTPKGNFLIVVLTKHRGPSRTAKHLIARLTEITYWTIQEW